MAVNQISDYAAVGTPAPTDTLIVKNKGITKNMTVGQVFECINKYQTNLEPDLTDQILGDDTGLVKITFQQILTYVESIVKGYVYGGKDGSANILQDNDQYSADADTWANKTSLPTPARMQLAASTILNKGYVFGGGILDTTGSQDTDEYTASTDAWANKTDMPTPVRHRHAAMTISDKGYTVAGASTIYLLQDTDEYTSTTDVWDNKTDKPDPAAQFLSGSTINTAGYVFGGNPSFADTDKYDPDVWTSKSNIPSAIYGHVSFTMGDKAYVTGGLKKVGGFLSDVYEYDPDTWTAKTSMSASGRSVPAATKILGGGYVFGGIASSGYLKDTNEYREDTWTAMTDMPTPTRGYFAASTMHT